MTRLRLKNVPKSVLDSTRSIKEREIVLNYLVKSYTSRAWPHAQIRSEYNPTSRRYHIVSDHEGAAQYANAWIALVN